MNLWALGCFFPPKVAYLNGGIHRAIFRKRDFFEFSALFVFSAIYRLLREMTR